MASYDGEPSEDEGVPMLMKASGFRVEVRRFERFQLQLQVSFRPVSEGEREGRMQSEPYVVPHTMVARSQETEDLKRLCSEDLSAGGMRISSPRPVRPGDDFEIHLVLPGVSHILRAFAQVRWCRPLGQGFQFGLQFAALNVTDLAKVEAFLAGRDHPDGL